MPQITDIGGNRFEVERVACAIQSGKVPLPIARIAETENFVVEQDNECPIEGFLVVVSKRHVFSIDELTDGEAEGLCRLLRTTRSALRKVPGISAVTLVQEENTASSHFHLWLFPWHNWMLKKWKGKLREIKEVMEYAKQELSGAENLEKIRQSAIQLRKEIKLKEVPLGK